MRKLILVTFIAAGLSACTTIKTGSENNSGLLKLSGTWELNYISGPRIAFNGLYPGKKPTLKFDITQKRVSGNSSCNSFSGKLDADDTHINFDGPLISTKMACPGEGEAFFFDMLKKVNFYAVDHDSTLNLRTGDVTIMHFIKK